MRILHVVGRYPPAFDGTGRWCGAVARGLAAAGHRVEVLSLAGTEPAVWWGARDDDRGVTIRRCAPSPPLGALWRLRGGARRTVPPVRSTALRRALGRALREVDVVHLHGAAPPEALRAWLLCRSVRRPLVVTPGSGAAIPAIARRAACVVARDEDDAARARGAGVAAARVVCAGNGRGDDAGHGCDPGLDPASRAVVFAGPWDGVRGAMTLVDAVRLLRLEGLPLVVVLVGDGGAGADRARRLWQAGQVPVHELPLMPAGAWPALLARASALVVPPRWDVSVVHDGWSAGTPVLVPDGERAAELGDAVVRVGEGPAALARELSRLVRDDARAVRVVASGRDRAAALPAWTEVAARVAAIYDALVAAPADARVAPARGTPRAG